MMTDIILLSQKSDRFTWGRQSNLTKPSPIREKYIDALRLADKMNYGALILSITSFGYNVANRNDFPGDFAKETGIQPDTLWGEGHYIRSENFHPAREVYISIVTALIEVLELEPKLQLAMSADNASK